MTTATRATRVDAHAVRPVRPVRALVALIVASAAMQAAVMISSTASTLLFARAVGESWSGLPGAVGVGGVALGSLLLTALMQVARRRTGLLTAYTAAAAGAALGLLGMVAEVWLVVPGMFLLGVGNAGAQLSRYAGAGLVPASRKGAALGAVLSAGTVGAVGGPALLAPAASAAGLVGLSSLAGAFLVATVATLTAAAVIASTGDLGAAARQQASSDAVRVQAPPRIRAAVAGMVVAQVVMVALMMVAPLHVEQHGHGLGAVGLVISVHVFGMYGLAPLTGLLADRLGPSRLLAAGLLVVMLSAAVMLHAAHSTLTLFVIALFALGYGWNMTIVAASTRLARDVAPGAQVRLQGLVEASTWGASAAAALCSTSVFALGGYRLLAAGCLLLAVVPLLVRARARRARLGEEAHRG